MITTRKKFYTTIAILTALSIISISGWIFLYFKILRQSESLASTTSNNALLERRALRASKLTHMAEELIELQPKLEAHFLTEDQTIDFLDKIESIAQKTGVSISPTNLSKNSAGELEFSIQAQGSYSALMNFSSLIERLPYELVSRQISIEVGSGETVSPQSKEILWSEKFSLTLKSFIPKEQSS